MKNFRVFGLSLVVGLALTSLLPAQNYPHHTPKPKPTSSASPKASATPAATETPAASATPEAPTGPLKMIKTDGKNKDSPIKVVKLDYLDAGYGAKYNSEVRVSASIQNSSKTDELKKVTMFLQIVNGAGGTVQEWKVAVGNLKPGQKYDYAPPVWYNSLGVTLQGKVMVEHEEVPKKKPATTTTTK